MSQDKNIFFAAARQCSGLRARRRARRNQDRRRFQPCERIPRRIWPVGEPKEGSSFSAPTAAATAAAHAARRYRSSPRAAALWRRSYYLCAACAAAITGAVGAHDDERTPLFRLSDGLKMQRKSFLRLKATPILVSSSATARSQPGASPRRPGTGDIAAILRRRREEFGNKGVGVPIPAAALIGRFSVPVELKPFPFSDMAKRKRETA